MLLQRYSTLLRQHYGASFRSAMASARVPSLEHRDTDHRTGTRTLTVLSKQSAVEYKQMNYSARMAQTGRPVSPHVTIYAFPVTALSSITNRVTGMLLSIGCLGLASAELVGGTGTAVTLLSTLGHDSPLIVAATAKFSVAFPMLYHYLGGLRHVVWDARPDLLTNVDAETSSYYIVGASSALALVAACV